MDERKKNFWWSLCLQKAIVFKVMSKKCLVYAGSRSQLSFCIFLSFSLSLSVYLYICNSVALFLFLLHSVSVFLCLCLYLFLFLSVSLSVCISEYMSICLSVYLSIWRSFFLFSLSPLSLFLFLPFPLSLLSLLSLILFHHLKFEHDPEEDFFKPFLFSRSCLKCSSNETRISYKTFYSESPFSSFKSQTLFPFKIIKSSILSMKEKKFANSIYIFLKTSQLSLPIKQIRIQSFLNQSIHSIKSNLNIAFSFEISPAENVFFYIVYLLKKEW